MRDMGDLARTEVSRHLNAPRETVYRAFLDPEALAAWLPPDDMTGVVHEFDAREGGTLRMSLVYPQGEASWQGKTSETADTFQARFAKLVPDELVVWAVVFESADPSFAGEMTVSTRLTPSGAGTLVTIRCDNIPSGIDPEDNEAGCRSSLEKLAAYLGG